MLRFKQTGLRWLKFFHLIAVCCWLGGAVSLLVISLLMDSADNSDILYGIISAGTSIDFYVVVLPGALGCLLSGICYGIFTPWGFFRHRWLIFKWGMTVSAILFGAFYLGPCEEVLLHMSTMFETPLQSPMFLDVQAAHRYGGIAQIILLLALAGVSIFKPWVKQRTVK